jgi:hypothetical protein
VKKQSNKEIQNYRDKALPKLCSNCRWYRSIHKENEWGFVEEKEIRCGLPNGLGGFAIKKQGICDLHENN